MSSQNHNRLKLSDIELAKAARNTAISADLDQRIEVSFGGIVALIERYDAELRAEVEARLGIDLKNYVVTSQDGDLARRGKKIAGLRAVPIRLPNQEESGV